MIDRLGTDGLIVTLPLVLFGVFRYLFLVHQRQMGGSPTEIVLKDRSIQLIVALYLVVVVSSIYFNAHLGLIQSGL